LTGDPTRIPGYLTGDLTCLGLLTGISQLKLRPITDWGCVDPRFGRLASSLMRLRLVDYLEMTYSVSLGGQTRIRLSTRISVREV
jgi:hypothetical protein